MKNPLELHINIIHPLPGFDMQHSGGNPAPINGAKVGALGIKGPWSLNPGNPNFPNHRPYLTNPKPPNEAAPVPSQKLKFT